MAALLIASGLLGWVSSPEQATAMVYMPLHWG
jgi:hypothetical protein